MFLTDVVLPKFIQDLCTLEVSPMDGQTLTEALHAQGINVRYIGKVAEGTKHLPHLWDLCSNEIAVRSAKHILKDVLRDTEDHDLGMALSHFFNCFFGSCQVLATKAASNIQSRTPKKDQVGHHHSSGKNLRGQARWKGRTLAKKSQSSYMSVSSDSLWADIRNFGKLKYQDQVGHHHSSGKNLRGQARWKGRTLAKKSQSSYMSVSSDSLWADIRNFGKLKYQ
ncbi:clustered mitochondria protein-like, partial [Cucurbita pepo subsp. pepo]|uniref:clustered mitochondria protein-like n=1 Tax=Cucurbita pepo subsp. pepo TaxID=3664 RepID=UPI000C9D48D3